MGQLIHILHLEDDPLDAELVQAKIQTAGLKCQTTCVKTGDEFKAALRQGKYDIILADYIFRGFHSKSFLLHLACQSHRLFSSERSLTAGLLPRLFSAYRAVL